MGNSIMYESLTDDKKRILLSIIKKYYASKLWRLQINSYDYYSISDRALYKKNDYKTTFGTNFVCFKNINEFSRFLDLLDTPYVIAENCYDKVSNIGLVLWIQNLKGSQLNRVNNYETQLQQLSLRLASLEENRIKMERELAEIRRQQNEAIPVAYIETISPSAPPEDIVLAKTQR